ncbi:melatonin receptor type 1a [Trichuris trichiura]|uniref:Melatonin receptor type 1a n=1 Tax=Trichuris trichiura TaxID=36087 RepID=A0A077YWC6_TRITR|nr:melatonin receptor type 1a [Trichuris trichiura]
MHKLPWLEEWRFLNNRTASFLEVFNVHLTNDHSSHETDSAQPSNDGSESATVDSLWIRGNINDYVVPRRDASTSIADVKMQVDQASFAGITLSAEKLAYVSIIVIITALLIVTSILIIAAIVTSPSLRNIVGCYMISLCIADLLCGTLITPVSVYSVIDDSWHWQHSELVCRLEAYIELVLLSVVLYIFMWISVDRYIAMMRPSRYETEQTFNRCKCWVMFTWITALLLCCPVLFSEMQARYDTHAYLCVLDCSKMLPYVVTMAVLVIMPSVACIAYTYNGIFCQLRNPDTLEDGYKGQLQADGSFVTTFLIIISFLVSWLPLLTVNLIEALIKVHFQIPSVHFALVWLAISSGCWKFFVYYITSSDFRRSLGALFLLNFCDVE